MRQKIGVAGIRRLASAIYCRGKLMSGNFVLMFRGLLHCYLMALMISPFLALQQAAPRSFRKCLLSSHRYHKPLVTSRRKNLDPIQKIHSRVFSANLVRASAENTDGLTEGLRRSSPLSSLSKSISYNDDRKNQSHEKKRFFPEISDKVIAYWLLGSAASVFGIVVFGGLTRLTESGLSITEWKPVTGSLPPIGDAEWDSEFVKYKSSPEFKLLNPNMTLSEFKSIYFMEWTHRIWGRIVGITFLLPSIYFIARRRVSAPMTARLLGIAGLIGFQGMLGWWMVKSGLKDDLFAPGSHPRVSQYRLTAHLGTAFICYTAMLWNGLSILRAHKLLKDAAAADIAISALQQPELRIFRRSVAALAVLVFCTAMSGGLVAGLDAGLIYNEFPYMGTGLTPPRSELFSDFYSHTLDKKDRWWRNMLENPSLAQLDHRVLATTTFVSTMGLFAYTKLSPTMKKLLPAACKKGIHGVVGFVCLQVMLGISTLIYLVPLPLASAHQAGSLALLSSVIILGNRAWIPGRAARLVTQRLKTTGRFPSSHISINRPTHAPV